MNELIKVTYDNDRPVVSARELHEMLCGLTSFESFFVAVCELKVRLDRKDLDSLKNAVSDFRFCYSNEAITYLCDCISCEKVLPFNFESQRTFDEKTFQKKIIGSFDSIFPDFTYVGNEVPVPNVGRIDILAKEKASGRDVIIELKVDDKNPTRQLLAYATAYNDPILVGVSTKKFLFKESDNRIRYYTYEELGI